MIKQKNKFAKGYYIRQALKLVDDPNRVETERILVLARQLMTREGDTHKLTPASVKEVKCRIRREMDCTLLSKSIIEQWEKQHPGSKSDRAKRLQYHPHGNGYSIPEAAVSVKPSELKQVITLLKQLGGKERLVEILHLAEEILQ